MNEGMVSYSNSGGNFVFTNDTNSFSVGDPDLENAGTSQLGACTLTYHYNPWDWWHDHHYHYHYPVYTESKVDKAFSVARILFSEGYIKKISIKEFIKLVNKIAEKL
jgi:hypothetical protein